MCRDHVQLIANVFQIFLNYYTIARSGEIRILDEIPLILSEYRIHQVLHLTENLILKHIFNMWILQYLKLVVIE